MNKVSPIARDSVDRALLPLDVAELSLPNLFAAMRSNLLTFDDAAKELGIDRKWLQAKFRRIGIDYRDYTWTSRGPLYRYNKDEWLCAKEMYDAGERLTDIADSLGISTVTLDRQFKCFGWQKFARHETYRRAGERRKKTNLLLVGHEFQQQSAHVKQKIAATHRVRYGVDNPSQAEIVKAKKRATSLKNHGVPCALCSTELREKGKITSIARYGTEYPSQSNMVREKVKKTCILKFGVDNACGSLELQEKARRTRFANSTKRLVEKLARYDYEFLDQYAGLHNTDETGKHVAWKQYRIKHKTCGTVFNDEVLSVPRCPACFPLGSWRSREEEELATRIRSYGVEVVPNHKRSIQSIYTRAWYETDIYLPERKIGVEQNGLFFHSINDMVVGRSKCHIDPLYHSKKTSSATATGTALYHVWQHDNPAIVEHMIKKILGHVALIDAKDLSLSELDDADAKSFFETTHLRGQHDQNERTIGLTDAGKVMAAASVRAVGDEIEILRFSTAKDVTVAGGVVRLVDGIRSAYPKARRVMTYKNRDWAPIPDQTDFAKAGFVFEKDVGPSEYWTDYKRVWREKPVGVSKVYPFYTSGNLLFTKELR